MRELVYFELKKSLNIIIIMIAAVLCAGWFFFCKYCFIGSYDNINGEIYRDYVNRLSGLDINTLTEYVGTEGNAIADTLSAKNTMQERYFNGEISDIEYLEYIDRYNYYDTRAETFSVISEKFGRFPENPSLRFIYDTELEGYLTTMTVDFPLVIMLMIFSANVFIPELRINPFILTAKNGRGKTLAAKLTAYLIITAVLITAYNFAELAALFSKELCDLSAPAASMDKFAALSPDISCFSLISQTFVFRIVSEVSLGMVFFAIASECRKYITFFSVSIIFFFFPALFGEILPKQLYGMTLYYSLGGNSILLDGNEIFAWIGILIWSAAALVIIMMLSAKKGA